MWVIPPPVSVVDSAFEAVHHASQGGTLLRLLKGLVYKISFISGGWWVSVYSVLEPGVVYPNVT